MSGSPSNKDKPPRSTAQPAARSAARQRGPAPPGGTSPARRRAAAILEVLAGVRRPSDAAQALGTSLPRYYQLERRALGGLLSACEPAPRGPRVDLARQLAALARENRRLQRECDRQQALVRMAERSLGLTAPSAVKPATKGKQDLKNGSTKRRRPRRASVRALQVVRGLRSDDEPEAPENGMAEPVAAASSLRELA
jgi:hypothetical protein